MRGRPHGRPTRASVVVIEPGGRSPWYPESRPIAEAVASDRDDRQPLLPRRVVVNDQSEA